jgi:two-component system chemotaxis response regulator CheB
VDDSAVARRVLVDVLSADPDIEVVGTATNGLIAQLNIPQLQPDIVTLDVEMPEMNGIEVLKNIHRDHPALRVIMFSALTGPGAIETLDALSLGALDYVTKPTDADNPAAAARHIREQLIPKIKGLCGDILRVELIAPTGERSTPLPPPRQARIDIVAIGVSTGGPNALDTVVPALPAGLAVPIVIVQHMPPIFTRHLAERLAARSAIAVREATGEERIQPGSVWIAPGDRHMIVERDGTAGRIRIHAGESENSCRPSVDVLFRSVASIYDSRALAVVMTGMGQDGLEGCRLLRAAGAAVVVQDEATSVVWGMPGSVVRAGLASVVLPLDKLADEITRRSRIGRAAQT